MSENLAAIRILGIWRWLYLTWLYRPHMRFSHRYNWHYTRKLGPFPNGSTQLWCEWCGLRYSTPAIDYALLARLGAKGASSQHLQERSDG